MTSRPPSSNFVPRAASGPRWCSQRTPSVCTATAPLLATLTDVTERRRTEEQLMQAIQEVMQDTAWFSRSVIERLAQIRSDAPDETPVMVSLTKRERQLLELVAAGYTNAQLVEELGLAKNTVRNYVARIYEKLDVHSRAEAVVWARERGIVAR